MIRSFAFVFLAAIPGCSTTTLRNSDFHPDRVLAEYNHSTAPGAAVIVLRGDSLLFRGAYGMAHLQKQTAVTPQTNFRLASVSKQFTATAVLLLIRDHRLSLGTRLTEIFRDFPPYGSAITVEHLLTHTSGLISYESLIPDSQTVQVRDRDVLRLLSFIDSTYFPPGTQFRYSNSGYAMLSLIVESVSGMRFAEFLKQRVFLPAGMKNTIAFEEGISAVSSRAFGYERTGDNWILEDQSVTSAVLGDGGIYSSVEDLAQWNKTLSESRLLGKELQRKAFSPQVRVNDSLGYGYGWYVQTGSGRPIVYHTGSTQGFRTALLRYVNDDLTVIFLTNRNEGDVLSRAESLAKHYLR